MAQTKVVSVRLPLGTVTRLKLLACKRSLEQQQEIRWTSIVREAIEKVLSKEKSWNCE
jgi:hypothetical protein